MKVSIDRAAEPPSRALSRLLTPHPSKPQGLSELRLRLCELLHPLEDEWALKEGTDGLYEGVLAREPAWRTQLAQLRGEQHEIVGSVRELIRLCDRSMAILESLELRRALLHRKLRVHEERENQLLLETYFRDVGGE